ncbi:helix-turn-helix domain-containing protein [Alteromonas gilva]|uniref:LuxR C-terminal-related transcriptional regulator n=1 Tax=Alteromonas gilva TaxID=2987522 RepID=A0ABT5L8S1_9ALTE|nr:LuxR C-terminal-related transcriptional regulator [Alteromonas gilva]MDC8832357.1 LuxR C-terminal-related transcriptional regulator [Alteromonas gilva]NVK55602.1 response regulator transcription factor [Alteromonadaceae bacterium]
MFDQELLNPEHLEQLSKRELQVAHKIIEGLPNKTIASQLFISERTVKFHCANIYRKLAIRNRAALMARYFRTLYSQIPSL